MRAGIGMLGLVLMASPAVGQGADSGVTSATDQPGMVLTVANGRMTVPVSVGGRGPYPFVIDTGAERSVVSHELAALLDLAPGKRARLFDFLGPSTVATVRVPSLVAGALQAGAIEAPALALENIGAPGLLGIDALQGQKVVVDFGRRRMSVAPARKRAAGQVIVKTLRRQGQLIVTSASYEGRRIAVILDTGSSISVGNPAMRALAHRPSRKVGRVSVTAVTGRTFDTDFVLVDDLTVGGVRFDHLPLSFADVAPFERFGLKDTPALILGMNSLRLFDRVEIDFANQEVAFTLPRASWTLGTCRAIARCDSL